MQRECQRFGERLVVMDSDVAKVLAAHPFDLLSSVNGSEESLEPRTISYGTTNWSSEAAGLRVMVNNVAHLLIPLFFGSLGGAFMRRKNKA